MKKKTYKCAFKHCKHESCEVSQDSAVKVGNRYMHKDCAEINNNIIKIKDTYYKKISKSVIMSQLGAVINNIIFKKNIDSSFLLFAIDYVIASKIPIRSPYGLHYLVDNYRIKKAWENKLARKIAEEIREEAEMSVDVQPKDNAFNYSANKVSGFGGIFKGGN